MESFEDVLKRRVLVLDGALGTMIQNCQFREADFRGREFLNHPFPLQGFNDLLNITKPSSIKKIHLQYLEAGANIITTNTFNSNAISMADYGLNKIEGLVKRLNREGARLARNTVEEYQASGHNGNYFIAGSIGPTNRSASLSPDITNPLLRNVTYDELYEAFLNQALGLLEGGVDLILCETFFDTLNLKAALKAIADAMSISGRNLPVIVSCTVSDNAGRILSGQSLQAFVTSLTNFDCIASIGLNCGFGPDRMKEYLKQINRINTRFTSCHPNAGLPDDNGCYTLMPEDFIKSIEDIEKDDALNIIGGCCGTTPKYVSLLKVVANNSTPHIPIEDKAILRLSGLDMLEIKEHFIIVGERCNVAGSAKFLRLIKENSLEEAAEIAKAQISKGAMVIDINMDDALLESKEEMVKFLRYILAEPDIAKVPFMVDSSKWDVIEAAMKEIQGKGIVNSLSLKEGEEIFIERAKVVKALGFALVVMAFDEKGQADSFERKVEICARSYDLLVNKCGYHPEDIIFDVNVMTIATGMKEHAKYALDFLKAVEWIKQNLPGARTSGGISNLSFAFRGKNKIREYMHAVFLHHARLAGLDMAIVNPSQNIPIEEIPEDIKNTIEDIIFDRNPDAVERLIEFANQETGKAITPKLTKEIKEDSDVSVEELLASDLIKGELIGLEDHIKSALKKINDPVKIIEGPLLEGMKKVGDLFGEGKMFLPQVVKTARSMKRAVEILTPEIEKSRKGKEGKKAGKILIATVKGDVHDIGKNIVSTVLSCNNYEIIDLGIMVPSDRIVEIALKENPDIICLSGLITPSLGEMTETVKQLKAAGITIPVMIGGAATSQIHTALKIAPEYDGVVLHMTDASQNPIAASRLLNVIEREIFIEETERLYENVRNNSYKRKDIIPYNKVLKIVEEAPKISEKAKKPELQMGQSQIIEIPIDEIKKLINWKMFLIAWKISGKYLENFPKEPDKGKLKSWLEEVDPKDKGKAQEAVDLILIALEILEQLKTGDNYDGKGAIFFEHAKGDEKNIYVNNQTFPMLRQQREGTDLLSVSDYFDETDSYIGFFAVSSGRHIHNLAKEYERIGDSYRSLIIQTLADRLAEASAEWLQDYVTQHFWEVNIRPAWGYPMMPDQTLILKTETILPYKEIGIELTENGAMNPPASISGIYISNSTSKYFMIGEIGEDQLQDYASRRRLPYEKVKSLLRQI